MKTSKFHDSQGYHSVWLIRELAQRNYKLAPYAPERESVGRKKNNNNITFPKKKKFICKLCEIDLTHFNEQAEEDVMTAHDHHQKP